MLSLVVLLQTGAPVVHRHRLHSFPNFAIEAHRQIVLRAMAGAIGLPWRLYTSWNREIQSILRQWRMRLERAEYEVALVERCYQEVDPANRLVAAHWSGAGT